MASIISWLPIVVLAAIAIGFACVAMRMRLPWFVGAPLSGIVAIVIFQLIGHFILGEDEKFLLVALVFGAIYGAGFALIPYIARLFIRKVKPAPDR